jgi:hypothetical protein
MFKTLQATVSKIRTVNEDSDITVKSLCTKPFQGIGQGEGCGPAIWVAISTPIIQMLYTAAYGMTLLSAISGRLVVVACFAFVDDTNVIHSQTAITANKLPTQCNQSWTYGRIHATSGALGPSKSHW